MLPRPALTYHPGGHPLLSRKAIDAFAEDFLRIYFPERLVEPGPVRPSALIELLSTEDGVSVTIQDLGSEGARKRLGRIYMQRKLMVLDHVLFTERQISLPFVVGHEIGHWLFHRDCPVQDIRERDELFEDDETSDVERADDLAWTSTRRLEWQASAFASALHIPKAVAISSIWRIQEELGIAVRKGIIYENTTPEGRAESEQQLDRIAGVFDVSKTVVRIRLRNLGLYHQQSATSGSRARRAGSLIDSVFDAG